MVNCKAPYPILSVVDSEKRVLQGFGTIYRVFRAAITITVFLAKNKHVWFELYKSCYSQLGGECHISRIRPIFDGIKPALSI